MKEEKENGVNHASKVRSQHGECRENNYRQVKLENSALDENAAKRRSCSVFSLNLWQSVVHA